MVAQAAPETTIGLRLYWVGRLAAAFPDGFETVTEEALTAWVARHRWGPETRRSVRSNLRAFESWLLGAHAYGGPAHQLPRVKVPRPRPKPASEDAFDVALKANPRIWLAVALGGFTGMRRGEIARGHTDHLERDLVGWSLRVVGKGGHVRMVPLPDDVAGVIQGLPPGWFFPSTRAVDGGRPISAAWLGKLVARELPGVFTTHSLRHRCGTVAYARTKDLRAVQELLGHSKPEITARYTLVPEEDIRAAVMAATGHAA